MKESERFALIKNAVANATKIVPQEFKGLLDELKAEKLAEEFVLANGLLPVSDDEVKEEFFFAGKKKFLVKESELTL